MFSNSRYCYILPEIDLATLYLTWGKCNVKLKNKIIKMKETGHAHGIQFWDGLNGTSAKHGSALFELLILNTKQFSHSTLFLPHHYFMSLQQQVLLSDLQSVRPVAGGPTGYAQGGNGMMSKHLRAGGEKARPRHRHPWCWWPTLTWSYLKTHTHTHNIYQALKKL